MLACLADLGTVIAALLTSRILIQFVGQIATVFYLQSHGGSTQAHLSDAAISLARTVCAGRLAVHFLHVGNAGPFYGVASLVAGVVAFLVWDRLAGMRDDKGPEAEE